MQSPILAIPLIIRFVSIDLLYKLLIQNTIPKITIKQIMNNMQQPHQHQPPYQKLTTEQVADIYQQKRLIDKDINENLSEIRMLNNKMAKNDYETTYLHKLQQRERMLRNKHQQLEDILHLHEYLQEQMNVVKKNQQNFRTTLADDYRKSIDEKKRKREEEKKREIEAEQAMIRYNQMTFEAEQERRRQELQENRRIAMEEVAEKQRKKQREKDQRERQKQQFNRKVEFRNNLQTQKQSIYKQYYNHFMQNQTNLQSVYNNKTAPEMNQRERQRQQFIRKEQEQFAKQQAIAQEQRVHRMNQERDMLRTFLQNQMQEKQRRKSIEMEKRRSISEQMVQFQMSQKEFEQMERMRKKEEQRRYDEELASQIKLRNQSNGDNSPSQFRYHNPITNPIDFRIGITNPYVIKQYEHTKQKFIGDKDLKLKHLAMVGNNSIAQ